MVLSVIFYVLGIVIWIRTYHSDGLIRITYITVIPVLLTTAKHFNVLFDKDESYDQFTTEEITKGTNDKLTASINNHKIIFILPLLLGVVAVFTILLLPWYVTTANVLKDSYYNCQGNCNVQDYLFSVTSTYDFFNIGISRYLFYLVAFLAVVGGIIILQSFSSLHKKLSSDTLTIGLIISTASSFAGIGSIGILYYYLIAKSASGFPHIRYYSLEIGLIIGIILILFSTAIAYNLNETIYDLINNQTLDSSE